MKSRTVPCLVQLGVWGTIPCPGVHAVRLPLSHLVAILCIRAAAAVCQSSCSGYPYFSQLTALKCKSSDAGILNVPERSPKMLQVKKSVQYNKIFWDRDHIDITFSTVPYYNCSAIISYCCSSLTVHNSQIRLYRRCVCIQKHTVYVGFGTGSGSRHPRGIGNTTLTEKMRLPYKAQPCSATVGPSCVIEWSLFSSMAPPAWLWSPSRSVQLCSGMRTDS